MSTIEFISWWGTRNVRIAVGRDDSQIEQRVSIQVNSGELVRFQEPQGGHLGCRFSDTYSFVWSHFELIVFFSEDIPYVRVHVDEAIVGVFDFYGKWLIVCEVSVRLANGMVEDRIELSEAVVSAELTADLLTVRYFDGSGDVFVLVPEPFSLDHVKQ